MQHRSNFHKPEPLPDGKPLRPDQGELVEAVLSRWLNEGNGRDPRPSNRLCRALAFCAQVELPANGKPSEPIAPELRLNDWPTPERVFAARGLTQAKLRQAFREAERYDGVRATLELELLVALAPRCLWPVVWQLIVDGPGDAARRAERALSAYAATGVAANRRRGGGELSKASIRLTQGVFQSLFGVFVELQRRDHPATELQSWDGAPKLVTPEGGRGQGDNSAPRLELVRLALEQMTKEVRRGLGLNEGEDEMEAMRAIAPTIRLRIRIFRVLRNRAALILMVLTAGRIGAIGALRRSDYITDHVGVPPDNRGGAAILLRPGKTLPADEVRVKVIPEGAARMIDSYLLWLDLIFEPAAKCGRYFQEHRELPPIPDDPYLLVSDRTSYRPFGPAGIRTVFGGVPPGENSPNGIRPPVIRESGFNPDVPGGEREFMGYPPHAFRKLATQLAERAGEEWNSKHPAAPGSPAPSPAFFGAAIADHRPPMDEMRAIYGDRGTRAAYELLSGRAIEIMWELLTTDRGCRRRPDVAQISERAEEYRAVEAELERSREAADRINASPRPPLPAKRRRTQPDPSASERELLGLMRADMLALEEGIDSLHRRVDGGEAVIRSLLALADQDRRLYELRNSLLVELSDLVHDRAKWELIPDTDPVGADHLEVNLEAVLRGEKLLPAQTQELADGEAVRDWLLPSEFAWACELEHRSRLSRWAAGRNLPADARRRPWSAEAIPIDSSLGTNWRRIWIPGVTDGFWPSQRARERVRRLLARWPDKQGWVKDGEPTWRSEAELVLPEPHRTATNEERTGR